MRCRRADPGGLDESRNRDRHHGELPVIPDQLRFWPGAPYRLHPENAGSAIHDFSAPEFFRAIALKNPEVLGPYASRIVVRPHEAKNLCFVATRPGAYGVNCADHDWTGMTARITVE